MKETMQTSKTLSLSLKRQSSNISSSMAETDLPPRFFKVFLSHFSSETMMIPVSYNDQLPSRLPKTATLHGSGGGRWKVAMKYQEDEVHFEHGWKQFVKDNFITDGDFMTFIYDGNRDFEVSIYGLDTCKEIRFEEEEEKEEEEEEHSICSLSSKGTSSESEMTNTIPTSKNKVKEEVEDSDDKEEDSAYTVSSEATDTETDINSETKKTNTNPKSRNKGKAKEESSEEDTDSENDSDYIEAFGRLDVSEESESEESSYSPKKKMVKKNLKKKDVVPVCDDAVVPKKGTKAKKVHAKIKNPETYLDDPNNVFFETAVKNRKYELLVHAQLVKDYCLKFEDRVVFIDPKGELEAKTAKWHDHRVCIKKWIRIIERNNLKREDRILCELMRKRGYVYAIKLHIVRGKDI